MAYRKRHRGSTTQRFGTQHAPRRRQAMAAHRDGDPCWRCGQPMYKWQPLDLDHLTPRALGGRDGPAVLAHARCNRSAGASLGNRMRGMRRAAVKAQASRTVNAPLRTSRNW